MVVFPGGRHVYPPQSGEFSVLRERMQVNVLETGPFPFILTFHLQILGQHMHHTHAGTYTHM